MAVLVPIAPTKMAMTLRAITLNTTIIEPLHWRLSYIRHVSVLSLLFCGIQGWSKNRLTKAILMGTHVADIWKLQGPIISAEAYAIWTTNASKTRKVIFERGVSSNGRKVCTKFENNDVTQRMMDANVIFNIALSDWRCMKGMILTSYERMTHGSLLHIREDGSLARKCTARSKAHSRAAAFADTNFGAFTGSLI
jgi:hypothetical protein